MVCPHCHQTLLNGSRFCQYCGSKIAEEVTGGVMSPKPENTLSSKNRKRSFCPCCGRMLDRKYSHCPHCGKRLSSLKQVIGIIAAVCMLLTILTLTVTLFIPLAKYNRAQKLLNVGEYAQAYEVLEELDTFMDAKEILYESKYTRAEAYLQEKDYVKAETLYREIRHYKDASIKCQEAKYLQAKELLANNKQNEANVLFEELGSYKDSAKLIHYHQYKLTSSTAATCEKDGRKVYKCTVCSASYTDILPKTGHQYKEATCTTARQCSTCGKKDGVPLGHTSQGRCRRCGRNQFKTLSFSGRGPGTVKNINLPEGQYNICGTFTGESNFIADFCYNDQSKTIANKIGSCTTIATVTSSEISPIKNAYIDVEDADGYWTFTIEMCD